MEPKLSDFRSAGFVVTREVNRPSYISSILLPNRIISASVCIAPFAPGIWCIEWTGDTQDQRLENARQFGLNSQALNDITAWVKPRFGTTIRWPNVIVDIDTAKELVDRFLISLPDVKVLELGLHRSMIQHFCRKAETASQNRSFAPMGKHGLFEVILEAKPVTQFGKILGFEPLVFDYSLSCSWLCNSLDTAVWETLGIKPNHQGFIEKFDDACRCVNYISRSDVGAEPGLWLPWLIIDQTENR